MIRKNSNKNIHKMSTDEIVNKLRENDKKIGAILRNNRVLYFILENRNCALTPEKRERYDRELATDKWKKWSKQKRHTGKL